MVKKIFPILIILLTWFVFSKPFFLDNKIPYPTSYQLNYLSLWNSNENYLGPVKNTAMPDVVGQLMPWRHFTIDSWKNLSVPLWNPYSFSGTPHLANYQSSVFSITNIFFFILNFNSAWGFSVLIAPLLAGIFMYLFTRSLKLSQEASLLASISFMFCGFITTWMSWSTLSLAISFLPLALFSIEKYFESKKIIYLLLLYISIPLSFFSGHFQISIYVLLFTVLFVFFKYFETKNKSSLAHVLAFVFLGILFSSPQLLSSIELYQEAPRSLIFQKINAIPFFHLPTIISPDFYGNPVTRNNFLGHYIEWNMFTGVIPFLLALYALSAKSRNVIFFVSIAIFSLIFCLDTPLLDAFVNLKVPVLSTSSLSRILCIFSFSIAVLAAFGLDKLKKNLESKGYKSIFIWLIIISIINLFLWFFVLAKLIDPAFNSIASRNLVLPTILSLGLIASVLIGIFKKDFIKLVLLILLFLTAFDMLRFATKWQPFESKELAYVETPIINQLKNLDRNFRIFAPFGEEGSVYFKFQSTEGYDPLYIRRYGEFSKSLGNGIITPADRLGVYLSEEGKYFPKVIDFLGIKYVLQKKSDIGKPWAFQFNKYPRNKFDLIYDDEKFQIFENIAVYPKAYLVGNYTVENNDQKIIEKVLDENFDLRKSVVLEKSPNIKLSKNLIGDTKIITYQPNKIIIEASSNQDSLLIVSDNYYPGWKAKVNGEETEVLRANYTFRAVSLPEGKSRVEFYYDPQSFRWGVCLTLISLFSIFIILIYKWYTNSVWNKHHKTAKSVIKSSARNAAGKQHRKRQ